MSILPVLEIPNPVLTRQAQPVSLVTPDIQKLLDDMLETMYATHGVGLAGNQVGVLKRVVVIDCAGEGEEPDPLKMVNPEIIWKSEETLCRNEGCLSIPREYADVERHARVTVRYTDENGRLCERTADGLLGVAIQHELDHLDGVLFIDHLSAFKRQRLLKHLEKRRRKQARDAGQE